ncbi:hypothetical protein GQ44DRAFT_813277 [Phaeosphaeriaceae sp. PMI808]|nr:hypothetical protein GQ44DRAFT_813277 [Phaeosphaeriaceae sp. PMI808]
MSWASSRETSRLEGNAYALLGIFGINMPLLYGEGEKAFVRLQEEIIKKSTDTSIFAWDFDLDLRHPSGLVPKCLTKVLLLNWGAPMLATSPRQFINSGLVKSGSSSSAAFTMTNRGFQIEIPLVPFPVDSGQKGSKKDGPWWVGLLDCWLSGSHDFVGIILYDDKSSGTLKRASPIKGPSTFPVGPLLAMQSQTPRQVTVSHGLWITSKKFDFPLQVVLSTTKCLRGTGYGITEGDHLYGVRDTAWDSQAKVLKTNIRNQVSSPWLKFIFQCELTGTKTHFTLFVHIQNKTFVAKMNVVTCIQVEKLGPAVTGDSDFESNDLTRTELEALLSKGDRFTFKGESGEMFSLVVDQEEMMVYHQRILKISVDAVLSQLVATNS